MNIYTFIYMCVCSTASCFTPRSPDRLVELAKACKAHEVFHVVNNAYGVQTANAMALINSARRKGGWCMCMCSGYTANALALINRVCVHIHIHRCVCSDLYVHGAQSTQAAWMCTSSQQTKTSWSPWEVA
jgi:hypothetical protein